jgi:DNA repair protein RecO (recombination protein O)
MIETASGLILRTRPLTETSLIVHWLTPQPGRLATVAKGARRPQSPFRGKLDLFYEADFTFVRSRRSDLHTLREVGLRDTHAAIRQDLAYLQQASYGAALIEQSTETDTPLPAIFELMQGFLHVLPRQSPQPHLVLALEIKLLHELGLEPDLSDRRLTPGSTELLKAFSASDWEPILRIKPTAAQLTELRQFLHGFLIYHLGKLPANRATLFTGV